MKSWLGRNNNSFCSISFIFLIVISFMPVVQAMEESVPVDNNPTKLHIVLRDGLKFFNHPSIYAMARTNSGWRKAVLDTAKNREDYIINRHPQLKKLENVVWNTYRTAYARASCGSKLNWSLYLGIRESLPCSKVTELMIERRFIGGSDRAPDYHAWQYCYGELPHKPCVTFNGIQDAYVHAYGRTEDDVKGHVVEYRLLSNGQHDAVRCVTKIGKKFISLQLFLEFPSLLKAFLESTAIMRIAGTSDKVFMIEGIVVPKDYRNCQQYSRTQRSCLSFDALPKKVQKAIVALYNSQNQVKLKKKQKNSCFI